MSIVLTNSETIVTTLILHARWPLLRSTVDLINTNIQFNPYRPSPAKLKRTEKLQALAWSMPLALYSEYCLSCQTLSGNPPTTRIATECSRCEGPSPAGSDRMWMIATMLGFNSYAGRYYDFISQQIYQILRIPEA